MSEAFDDHVAGMLGINRTDLRCLDVLDQRGPITAGELATAMHLSSGAITTLVDRLERAGFAQRRRDTGDRRRVLVELAPKLHQLGTSPYEALFEGTVELTKGYTNRDLERMIEFLERGKQMVEEELRRLEKDGADDAAGRQR